MQIKNLHLRYFVFSIALILLNAGSVFSINYTAISSGNWSSTSTWGGPIPGINLSGDAVTIPLGIDVTLDVDVTIGLNSSITVDGSLVGTANNIFMNFGSFGGSGLLNIHTFDCGTSTNINLSVLAQFSCDTLLLNGALAGAGTINTGYIDCGAAGTINMPTGSVLNSIIFLNDGNIGGSGTYNIGKLDCGATANINLAAGGNLICDTLKNQLNVITIADGTLQINQELELIAGSIRLTNNALLFLSDTCLIRMRGGRIKNYTSNDIIAPLNIELSNNADTLSNDLSLGEAHFKNISFNFTNPSQEIVLGEDIFVEGTFDFSNGILNLFNHSIKFLNDFISGQGRFKGSTTCALFFENSGRTDTLKFEPGYENLCILAVSRDTNLILGTNLDVDSVLNFSGQKLMLNGNNLNVNGDFSLGNGLITGNNLSGLSFNGHGLIDTLEFAPGQNILNQFSVNIDSLNQVILGSDIHITGNLFTTSGEVVLQGTTLTVSGSITKNNGLLVGSASASIIIEGVDTAGIIAFKPGYEILDSLVVNRQGTIVNGMSTGVLWLQGNLTLNTLKVDNGMFNLAGEDSTTAKASGGKNVTVNSTTDMNGMVGVASTGPMKNIGMQIDLNLNGDLITTATGLFAANTNLDINISGSGSMDTLAFTTAYDTISSLVYNNATELILGSDIAIYDTLSMSSGTINIANSTLSINGTLIIDYAAFIGSPMANMIISGSANIDTLIFLAQTAELNDFTVSVDSGNSVTLGADLTVNGNLYMVSGELALSGDTLTINGNVTAENGSLTGNADATIIIGGADSLGTLSFTEGAQMLNELVINRTGAKIGGIPSGQVGLGSDLTINKIKILNGMANIIATGPLGKSGSNGEMDITINNTLELINGAIGTYTGDTSVVTIPVNLTLNGNLETSANGQFVGSDNLSLIIDTAVAIVDTLTMTEGYEELASLVYSSAEELILGSDLVIYDTLQFSSGNINIANSTLSINGTLLIDYAAFIGSPMANMIISGSADIDTLIFLAQTAELNNFTVSVDSGNSVTLGGDLTVNGNVYMVSGELVLSGDTLTVNGNIVAENGSLTGNANATLIIGGIDSTSVLTFTEGAQELKELVLNSIGDTLLLGSNLKVDSLLTLTQGMLNIGSYNLTIDSLAAISGYNKYNYIAISDTGKLIQYLNDTGISVTFPIGTLSAYTPVTLNQNSFTEFGQYAANVIEGVYTGGDSGTAITQNAVNTTWNVSTTLTDYNVSMQVGWSQYQELPLFNSDSCYISHYNGTAWDTLPVDSAIQDTSGMFYIQRDSITGMSPFAVMSINPEVCQITTTTLITNASSSVSFDGAINIAVTTGQSPFTYSWTPTTGQLSIINPDSAVIDGLNTGSYMVTISDNNGCEVIDTFFVDFSISVKNELTETFVKIYPNPSDGILFIDNAENSSIEIYDILGNVLLKLEKVKYNNGIDVSKFAKGNYFVRIKNDDFSVIQKITIE